jgi:hypothetical protein
LPGRRVIARLFVSSLAATSGSESELLQADIDHPTHFAFRRLFPVRRPLSCARTRAAMSGTLRLPQIRIASLSVFKCLSQTLQLKNKSSFLRSDTVAIRASLPVAGSY